VATKKVGQQIFFLRSLFCCCFWIRDPRSEIGDPGWTKKKDPGPATLRIGNIFLYCLTLCRRYKDSAHLNVLLISIEQLLGSNHLIITILKVTI
jgi:hypothetical protein